VTAQPCGDPSEHLLRELAVRAAWRASVNNMSASNPAAARLRESADERR
jgi:hypothetical protein